VVLLLTRSGGRIFSPFAAIGAMTLTLYSAHVVILAIDVLDPARPRVSLWVQIISFMLFALVWRSAMGRGPLEQIISDSSDWVRTRILSSRHPRAGHRQQHAESPTPPLPLSGTGQPNPGPPPSETDLPAKVPRPTGTQ
jgi:hypothetical protein